MIPRVTRRDFDAKVATGAWVVEWAATRTRVEVYEPASGRRFYVVITEVRS